MPELEVPAPRESALLCWPVLWDANNEGPAPKVTGLHVTAFYWPAYGEFDRPPCKEKLLDALANWGGGIYRGYTIVKVESPEAFGEDSNYPVLVLNKGHFDKGLYRERTTISNCMRNSGLDNYDSRWPFNPHCSVDLKTALDPPKQLIIGPPELWYKDDEPVKI